MKTPAVKSRVPLRAVAAAISALSLVSCWILPMGLPEYELAKLGPPLYFFDDFEQNDGKFSTKYYYELRGSPKPLLDTEYAYSGSHCIRLAPGAELKMRITVPGQTDGVFEFRLRGNSHYGYGADWLEIELDDDPVWDLWYDGYLLSKGWVLASFSLPWGEHEIRLRNVEEWGDDVYYCLDDLCFAGFMADATPQEQELFLTTPSTLNWGDLEDAEKYHLQLAYADTFTDPVVDADDLADSHYSLLGLEPGRRCCWRVRPLIDGTWRQWGITRTFLVNGPFTADSFETHDSRFSTLNAWKLEGNVPPRLQNAESYDGSWAAQFGGFSDGKSSFSVQVDPPVEQFITFRARAEDQAAQTGTLRFRIGADSNTLNPQIDRWTTFSFLLPPDPQEYTWENERYDYDHALLWVDDIEIFDIGTFTGDDFEDNNGTTSNAYHWIHGGVVPPQLVGVGQPDAEIMFTGFENGDSDLVCYTYFSEPKIIKFYVTFQTYWGGDVGVWVDGTNERYVYPTKYLPHSTGGQEATPEIPAGVHQIIFRNRRSGDTATDSVWIDDVTVETP